MREPSFRTLSAEFVGHENFFDLAQNWHAFPPFPLIGLLQVG
jgi:hypothetical protein